MERKGKLGLLLALGAMLLTACGGSSSEDSGDETETSATITSDGGQDGDSVTSGADADTVMAFDGIVRLYYHNDENDYSTKRLWIWATGIDGNKLGETMFTNQNDPDDYGVYYDVDLQAEPFAGTELASIYFIVKEAGTWSGQSNDILVNFGSFGDYITEREDGREMIVVYGCQGTGGSIDLYQTSTEALGDRINEAYFTDWKTIYIAGSGTNDGRDADEIGQIINWTLYGYDSEYYQLSEAGRTIDLNDYLIDSGTANSNTLTISLDEEADLSLNYTLEANFLQDSSRYRTKSVSAINLYDTDKFEEEYTYDGDDLGFTVGEDGYGVYKLWAPTASRVQLYLYTTGETAEVNEKGLVDSTLQNHVTREMTRGDDGVWYYTSDSSLPTRRYYTYYVTTSDGSQEVIDPYAKAAGINGLRGYVMNDSTWAATDAKPDGFDEAIAGLENGEYAISAPNELTVYEAHIRDLTMDETWTGESRPGTYAAFSESGTTYTGEVNGQPLTVTTGYDHIVETGVNAIQLLPVFDHDNDERPTTDEEGNTVINDGYNWGYNPQNYNVVEGSYSTDPYDPVCRIYEYKDLIRKYAEKGIRIIMDVVYNHLSSVSNNCFNKIVPDYWFRKDSEGNYIDGSGTGNVTASERTMVRKYIVDSVSFWAEQYGIKGFRFDLMGCLDTITMREVKDALYDIDPQIVVYGEGWDGGYGSGSGLVESEGCYAATTSNAYSILYDTGKGGIGCFNDGGRDGLKGNTAWEGSTPEWGFVTKGSEDITDDIINKAAYQFLGANYGVGHNPAQTVNYVACHDNYTLYDQMNYCLSYPNMTAADSDDAIEATVATNAAVMLSQGIAFLNGGDEIFRQKIITPDDPYYDTIKSLQESDSTNTDAFEISDGNLLVRNSYCYGDECNSFKWDRKVEFYEEYQKTAEAIEVRNELMGNVFGMSYEDITQNNKASIWGDLGPWSNSDNTVIAANYNPGDTYYVMLGGRADSYSNLSIGNDTVEVIYSSSDYHREGDTFTISNYTLGIGRFECLLLRKTS